MEVTKQERELIEFIRELSFDDLLDATFGITAEGEKALESSKLKLANGDLYNERAFRKRYEDLEKLAELLGDSNVDYRRHIDPDFEEPEVKNECSLLQ